MTEKLKLTFSTEYTRVAVERGFYDRIVYGFNMGPIYLGKTIKTIYENLLNAGYSVTIDSTFIIVIEAIIDYMNGLHKIRAYDRVHLIYFCREIMRKELDKYHEIKVKDFGDFDSRHGIDPFKIWRKKNYYYIDPEPSDNNLLKGEPENAVC